MIMLLRIAIEVEDGVFWGRTYINGNLIVAKGDCKEAVFSKMKALVFAYEGEDVESFEEVEEFSFDD
jgi:hypothetical protein